MFTIQSEIAWPIVSQRFQPRRTKWENCWMTTFFHETLMEHKALLSTRCRTFMHTREKEIFFPNTLKICVAPTNVPEGWTRIIRPFWAVFARQMLSHFLLQISARPRETKRRSKKPESSDDEARKPPKRSEQQKQQKKRPSQRPVTWRRNMGAPPHCGVTLWL